MSGKLGILGAQVEFATRDEGRAQIRTPDYYSNNLTEFDRMAKTRLLQPVTEAQYLDNAAAHVRAWTLDEVGYLSRLIERLDSRCQDLKLKFELPDPLVLVKTDGWEEGGANGYTRANAIYLNRNSISPSPLAHEVFHVVSRYNDAKIDQAYAALGFQRCNEIVLELDTRITNPDAPYLRHFVTVEVQGEPCDVAMIMVAARPYSGGGFFGYVRKKLVVVGGAADAKTVRLLGGEPVLIDHREPIDLYDRLGRNTGYNIHQEEVTADHFELLLSGARGLPQPELLEALHRALAA